MIRIIFIILLLAVNVQAQEFVAELDDIGRNIINEQMRRTYSRIDTLENATVSLTSGVSGVLPMANGGTGEDLSGESQGSIVFMGSDTTLDMLSPSTTSGWYLQSNGTGADPSYVSGAVDYEDGTLIESIVNEVFSATTSRTYVKKIEFSELLRGGTISVKWFNRCHADNNAAKTMTARVYINDVGTGTEYVTTSADDGTFTTTTGISVSKGDVISIYVKETGEDSSQQSIVGIGQILSANPTSPSLDVASGIYGRIHTPYDPDDGSLGTTTIYLKWSAVLGQRVLQTEDNVEYRQATSGTGGWT